MLPTTIFVHKIKLCVNGLYFILLNAGNTILGQSAIYHVNSGGYSEFARTCKSLDIYVVENASRSTICFVGTLWRNFQK